MQQRENRISNFKFQILNRLKWATVAVALTLVAVAAHASIKKGDSFPNLAGFKLEGKLPDSVKGKVVIVDFWASWCGPCHDSFPVLNELYKKYSDKGLVIIGVNVDEKKSDMQDFLKDTPATFTVVRDGQQSLVNKVDIGVMPSSFVLDRDGKVQYTHSGFHGDQTKKDYISEIEALLAK